jgi:hypothetical protein
MVKRIEAGQPEQAWLTIVWDGDRNVFGGPFPSKDMAVAAAQDNIDNGLPAAVLGPITITFL